MEFKNTFESNDASKAEEIAEANIRLGIKAVESAIDNMGKNSLKRILKAIGQVSAAKQFIGEKSESELSDKENKTIDQIIALQEALLGYTILTNKLEE